MNPGRNLQVNWRAGGKPLRVRITQTKNRWVIAWWCWKWKQQEWREWRTYVGTESLRQTICDYREYALDWRGFGDQ